jgi:DNA gyrase/topoisomerase IV subunit B
MLDAIACMRHENAATSKTGVLAVLSIDYPKITFEGCIKSRIGNPELRERVCDLVTTGLKKWVRANGDEVNYLKRIQRLQFADIW